MSEDTKQFTFEELIEPFDGELKNIGLSVREIIKELHPDFTELIWEKQNIASYGFGPKKMSQHYVYLGFFKAHVNLGFYFGADLDDPSNLLEGAGKKLRHIKLKSVDDLDNPEVKKLIALAIENRIKANN